MLENRKRWIPKVCIR